MRIISQDGTIDIPYELSAVTIGHKVDLSKFNINIRSKLLDERPCIVAIYSTEEKAKKAMEMLRERHTDNVFCREDIQYKAEIMLDEGLNIVREMMMKCEYFQFPKDDEVKV